MTEENSRAAEEEEKFNIILTTAPLIAKLHGVFMRSILCINVDFAPALVQVRQSHCQSAL
jgi:hypothetical protein